MNQPRGARGGERNRRQQFYVHQDYCIQQAWRRYQYTLAREDFRQLDAAGNNRYINGVAQVFETYGADWSQLCAEVPALAAVVPVAKGGTKGKGKGKPADPKRGGKGQGQQEAPGTANPKAKPQAVPKAEPKQPAAGAPAPKARDTPGTPAAAKAVPLGGGGPGSGASSSSGLPVAAPKAGGAAPPAEPKSAAPEPEPAASEQSDAPQSAPAAPDAEEEAPEPAAEEPAPLTAAEVLPKEEPELGEVKEEPGEEEQKTDEVVKEEAPDDEIDAGAAGAPAVDTVADAAPDDIDTGAAEAPDVDCVEAGDDSGAGPEDAELEAAEDPEGGTDEPTEAVPIDVDEEEAVHSSPAPEAAVGFVHSPASPDFSERAFSEPPERPHPEGRLRTRPRILRPPSDLPPGTYPTVRLDRQGLWILVSPNPGLPATSGVRDAEQLDAPDPTEGAAPTTEHIDPYELSQEQWVDLASVFAKAPASIDLSTAPVVSARRGERTVEGFRAGVGAFAKGEVIEARSPSPARSRSPKGSSRRGSPECAQQGRIYSGTPG